MLRRLYDWTMAKAAHPHAEWWLALFAFVEASFFPIPPHPVLGLMCLAEPKSAVRFATDRHAGFGRGRAAGLCDRLRALRSGGRSNCSAVLGLTESFPVAACYLREYGAEIIMIKGATPIPFKLLTITAGFIGMNLVTFILASLVSRAISFMIVGILFRIFGRPIKAFIDKYLGLATAGFVVLVVAGFLALTLIEGGGDANTQERCAHAVANPQIV